MLRLGPAEDEAVKLSPVVARFFDGVMVMDKDVAVRNNRLALLAKCNALLMTAGDLSVMA